MDFQFHADPRSRDYLCARLAADKTVMVYSCVQVAENPQCYHVMATFRSTGPSDPEIRRLFATHRQAPKSVTLAPGDRLFHRRGALDPVTVARSDGDQVHVRGANGFYMVLDEGELLKEYTLAPVYQAPDLTENYPTVYQQMASLSADD